MEEERETTRTLWEESERALGEAPRTFTERDVPDDDDGEASPREEEAWL